MNRLSLATRRLYTLTTGPAIPAWLLRLLLVVIAVVATVQLTDLALWRGLLLITGVAAAIYPKSFSAWLLIVMIGISVLSGPMDVGRLALAVLCVHAAQVLGSLTFQLPARGMVQLRALVPTVIRFAVIQLVSQLIAVPVVLFLRPQAGPGVAWFAVLGMLALLGLASWLFLQLSADFEDD